MVLKKVISAVLVLFIQDEEESKKLTSYNCNCCGLVNVLKELTCSWLDLIPVNKLLSY